MQPLRMLEPHSYYYCDMCARLFFPRRIFIFSPKSHNWLYRCLIERNNYELRFVFFFQTFLSESFIAFITSVLNIVKLKFRKETLLAGKPKPRESQFLKDINGSSLRASCTLSLVFC